MPGYMHKPQGSASSAPVPKPHGDLKGKLLRIHGDDLAYLVARLTACTYLSHSRRNVPIYFSAKHYFTRIPISLMI